MKTTVNLSTVVPFPLALKIQAEIVILQLSLKSLLSVATQVSDNLAPLNKPPQRSLYLATTMKQ